MSDVEILASRYGSFLDWMIGYTDVGEAAATGPITIAWIERLRQRLIEERETVGSFAAVMSTAERCSSCGGLLVECPSCQPGNMRRSIPPPADPRLIRDKWIAS